MIADRGAEYYTGIVTELRKLPHETEWVEFKVNNADPQEIGEYLSALSNAAAYNGKASAYMVWGVENETHNIAGTTFSPAAAKKGNEPLETWLLRLLTPKINFHFHEFTMEDKPIVLLQITRAHRHPVQFSGEEFIRIGQSKKPLKGHPDREQALWRIFDRVLFEDLIAVEHTATDDVLRLLDYPAYFDLLELPLPSDSEGIISALIRDGVIQPCEAGGCNITNLGAILFAKRLSDFRTLRRKGVRVIQYKDTGRTETIREQEGGKGYASGFSGLIDFINNLLPTNEVIGQALRKTVPMYPELAVRELVANAIIHQDFAVIGAGPMVEIFTDRIEITNPGTPLVDTRRFVDTPPKSRNEALASLMRRFRICEERGSGIDKVVFQIELFQLPAPLFEAPEGFTKVTLFAHKTLNAMERRDRVRACYLHACIRYVMRQPMTNTSVRERFGIEEKNAALASRLLAEALEDKLIIIRDPNSGNKGRSYLPFWAAEAG